MVHSVLDIQRFHGIISHIIRTPDLQINIYLFMAIFHLYLDKLQRTLGKVYPLHSATIALPGVMAAFLAEQ